MTFAANDNEKAVLRFSKVRKSYGSVVALNSVDLALRPAEIVGLLGPNGAGKSTLFQIGAGLFAPDSGEVRLFGSAYARSSYEILRRLGVVFQSRSLDLDISVRANLHFHGNLFGLFGRTLRARIGEVCEQMQIGEMLDLQVRKLSGGNQRRVEIARALLNQPDLLLLDEPSTGLDATARASLAEHIRSIVQSRGLSVLWATHIVDEIEEADRVVLMMKGTITAEGTPAALIAQAGAKSLTAAYIALTGHRPE